MNREIKFRVWQPEWDSYAEYWKKDHPKMDYDYAIGSDNIESTRINGINSEKDVVFMQYTGLKDKNGKEIYEGDILKSLHGMIGSVYYNDDAFLWSHDGCRLTFDDEHEKQKTESWAIIIGNIYENPELIK